MVKGKRELTGMSVTEFRAKSQEDLFLKLARFVGDGGVRRGIETIGLDWFPADSELANPDGRNDVAIVVWA